MDLTITNSRLIPITDQQLEAFKSWAVEKYANFHTYINASRNQTAVDVYIRANILTEEMKAVLCESEPLMGNITTDIHEKRMQLYHKRIINKINYMKMKLGEMVFAEEIRQLRRQIAEERMLTGIHYIIPWRTSFVQTKNLPENEHLILMQDDCAICLEKHPMIQVSETSCKHQFGKECIAKWKPKSCPVCRSRISEANPIFEYV